jgi:hypothetical protein
MVTKSRESITVNSKEIVIKHHDVSLVIDDDICISVEDNYGEKFNTINYLTNDELKAIVKFLQDRII